MKKWLPVIRLDYINLTVRFFKIFDGKPSIQCLKVIPIETKVLYLSEYIK